MWTQKSEQDSKAHVNHTDLENARGLTIEDANFLMVADDECIYMYDEITCNLVDQLKLNLPELQTRDETEIIQVSLAIESEIWNKMTEIFV